MFVSFMLPPHHLQVVSIFPETIIMRHVCQSTFYSQTADIPHTFLFKRFPCFFYYSSLQTLSDVFLPSDQLKHSSWLQFIFIFVPVGFAFLQELFDVIYLKCPFCSKSTPGVAFKEGGYVMPHGAN
jgi:hypothetical protein